jgi:hypothetical protein
MSRSYIVVSMNRKQGRPELAKKSISRMKKELQTPRLTESVRKVRMLRPLSSYPLLVPKGWEA